MAVTRLSDVIIPEIFTPYTVQRSQDLSNIISSGIATTNGELNRLISGAGETYNMPYFNDLTGDAEVISDGTPLVPQNIGTAKQIAVAMNLQKSWGATFLSSYVSGADPMRVIGDRVASWWVGQEQKILVSILTALFNGPTTAGTFGAGHIKDEGTTAITNDMLIDSVGLMGDHYRSLSAMIMHSAVYQKLIKLNLIQYVNEPTNQSMNIPTYLGLRIILDDGVEVVAGSYRTYIFGAGAISYGIANLEARDATEVDRDVLMSGGEDVLVTRRRMTMHPNGFQWVGGANPSYSDLATSSNWTMVFDTRAIPMVCLKSGV